MTPEEHKDDEPPQTFWRTIRDLDFWLLVVAGIATYAGVAWFVVWPLATAGLSISSLPKYIELWPRARAVGAERVWWTFVGLSTLNSLAAAGGTGIAGLVSGWFWG